MTKRVGSSWSRAFRTKVALISAPLAAATRSLLSAPDLPQLVISQLVLLHQIVRASGPLMEMGLRECERRHQDNVCRTLAAYLVRHIEEERDHDEWILQDLESVGVARSLTLSALPSSYVAALVGAQYYWILHYHPVALVGYMTVIESNAPTMELIERLKRETGLPDTAFRSHRVHAQLDPHHQAELFQLVDALALSVSQEQLISSSAMHTAERLADCLANPNSWNQAIVEYTPRSRAVADGAS